MKPILFLFALLLIAIAGSTQEKGTAQLYGYYQAVSRGRAPEINAETGLRTSQGQGRNYRLYAVSPALIYPAEIWVEGVRMGVTIKTITQTPVEYSDDADLGAAKKVLVPQTTQQVRQLILTPAVEGKNYGKKAESLAKSNDLVLVYKQGGKFYYTTLKSLSALNSTAAQ